ncbi:MAG TPA: hypothetical protein VM716_02230 [Gemmatimonadales bacterium]|nr:hypothetical protein [Gemmatimonadales bacterium]
MSRSVRGHEPPQPAFPLGHSLVHWDTLPPAVRERVLALWLQLLTEHLAHEARPRSPEERP